VGSRGVEEADGGGRPLLDPGIGGLLFGRPFAFGADTGAGMGISVEISRGSTCDEFEQIWRLGIAQPATLGSAISHLWNSGFLEATV